MFAMRPSAPSEAKSGNPSLAKEEEKLEDKDQHTASPQAHLRLGEIKVTGGLSEGAIRRVLKRQLKSLEFCLQAEGKEGGSRPTGKVVLRFALDPQGRVSQIGMSESNLKDPDIEQCILQKLQRLSFPAPRDGRKVSVTLSLILR